MNALQLRDELKRRVPGYTNGEYLAELNRALNDVFNEIAQLDNYYYTRRVVLTLTAQADVLDLIHNSAANYSPSSPIHPRIYQIQRLRVRPNAQEIWLPAKPRPLNHPDLLARSQQDPAVALPQDFPPYYYTLLGKGMLRFAAPLPAGSQIEIVYSFGELDMAILENGTVSSSGTTVTGTNTTFTHLLPPDLQALLPDGTFNDEQTIEAELVVAGRPYRVTDIASDTSLTTAVAISPAASGSAYALATVPAGVPEVHHDVILDIATRNMLSTPAEDDRFMEWAAIARSAVDQMKNTLLERVKQENPRRIRFPYGVRQFGRR